MVRKKSGNDETFGEETGSITRPTGKVTRTALLQLAEWQGFRCPVSGRNLIPTDSAVDYVLPVTRGGSRTMENVQIVHKEVAEGKRNLTSAEYLSLCAEVLNQSAQKTAPDLPVSHCELSGRPIGRPPGE